MDDIDLERRSDKGIVHFNKKYLIVSKSNIVSRGIELSNIIELYNLEKYDTKYLSEVNPTSWLNKVIELRGSLKFKEAYDLINLVLKIKPKLKEAYFIKGEILRWSGGMRGAKSDSYEAIESYNEALKLAQTNFFVLDRDPQKIDYDIYMCLGECFDAISDYKNAIKASENAILLTPDRYGGWECKADYLSRSGNFDAAIYYYDKTISIIKNAISNNIYLGHPLDDSCYYYKSRLADDLVFKGVCLKNLGKCDEAIKCYKEALELNPDQDRIWEYIGLALQKQGKNEEANQYYLKEINSSKYPFKAWHNMAISLRELGKTQEALYALNEGFKIKPDYDLFLNTKVDILTDLKRYDEALVALDDYLKLKPDDSGALNWKGVVLSHLKKHEEAIIYYEEAHKNKFRDYLPLANKARSLMKLNRFEEALDSILLAKKFNPKISEIWDVMGDILSKLGKTTEANEACYMAKLLKSEEALVIDSNLSVAWYNKGCALLNFNRYEEAIACFDRALAIDPKYINAWINKGNTLNSLKRFEEAIAHYNRVLTIDQNHAGAWHNKGVSLNDLKRYNEAIACYNRVLTIDPNKATTWCNKGITLNDLNCYKEAIAAFDRALTIDPNYTDALCNKGISLRALNRNKEAIAVDDQALDINPNLTHAWHGKGNALNNLKRYEEAIAAYDQALSTDPNFYVAWYNKGTVLNDLKCYKEAIVAYDRALAIYPNYTAARIGKNIALDNLKRSKKTSR